MAQLWFGGTALFSEYSCIYNFETTILNIQYSMKCEYWILNIRVYNWLRPVLSKVSCWVAQEWLERLRCFLNTHVFIILKIECWTFNIQWNVNIEYWIFRYTLGRLVLSKVSCWVAQQWFGETALFSEYSSIYHFESTMNIQYWWKWLCKESCIKLG